MARITVLAGSTSVQIAKNLAVKMNASYVESSLRVFADGESKINAKLGRVRGKIVVVQSMYPPVDTHLLHAAMLIAKAKESASEVTAVIPYMGYARQDKKFLQIPLSRQSQEIQPTASGAFFLHVLQELVSQKRLLHLDQVS